MKLGEGIRRFMLSCSLLGIAGLAVFTLPLSTLYAADPVGWEDLGLYGGQMNDIALDPEDPIIMFVGAHQGDGLFKSTNGGRTWQQISLWADHNVFDLAINPQNTQQVWAITGPHG